MNTMSSFIVIDWGTSNFRAVLIDKYFKEIDSISTNDGMLTLKQNEFHPFLLRKLHKWLSKDKNIKIFMSGMVGSINGWLETKYLLCEVHLDDLVQNLVQIPNIDEKIYIVPGIKIEKNGMIDLMRGEEVQVFGALKYLDIKDAILILPGTHSKWVKVKNNKIVDFITNMTGEVFSVMSSNTILAKSIKFKELDEEAFEKGMKLSLFEGGLLNHMFQARTQAFNIGENGVYSFLSAIIIGNEIKQMNSLFSSFKSVVIVGTSELNNLYKKILNIYDIKVTIVNAKLATNESMKYLYKNLNKIKKL